MIRPSGPYASVHAAIAAGVVVSVAFTGTLSGQPVGTVGASLDYIRNPLSIREQTAGTYGSYDLFKVYSNPALLAYQTHTWEAALSNNRQFAGGQNIWALGGSWIGSPLQFGSVGGAVFASGLSTEPLQELDFSGNPTGVEVKAGGLQVGLQGMAQWKILSGGLGLRYASESFKGPGIDVQTGSGLLADLGVAWTLGSFDFGGAVRGLGLTADSPSTSASIGAAYRIETWWLNAAIGGQWEMPISVDHDLGKVMRLGMTWNVAQPYVAIRAGSALHVNPFGGPIVRPMFGLSIGYASFSFDYAAVMDATSSSGIDHLVGLDYAFGATTHQTPADEWKRIAKARRGAAETPVFAMKGKGETLAVVGFDAQNVSAGDAAVISDLFRNDMVKQRTFEVVEKGNMDKILQEQAFQQTGCTTQECAVKLGKILNVKFLVVGSFGKLLDRYVLTIRVVEVETARIVYSDSEQGKDVPEVQQGITRLAERLSRAVSLGR